MSAEKWPEWLPDGWKMKVQTRKNGIKDRYYISPVSGYTFRSKVGVMRSLNCEKFDGQISKSTCFSNKQLQVAADVENLPEWLPAGWLLETKTRMRGTHAGKNDKYYIDPVGGYVFRSLKDAFRYVEKGEISKRALRPKKRSINEMYALEKKSTPAIAAKRLKSRSKVRRCLFTRRIPNSNGKMVVEMDESPEKTELGHASTQCLENADLCCLASSNDEHFEEEKAKKVQIGNHHYQVSHADALLIEPLNEIPVDPSERKQLNPTDEPADTAVELLINPLALENQKLLDPENEKPLLLEYKQYEKSGRVVKKRGGDRLGSSKSKAGKAISVPRRTSKRLAGLEADPVTDIGIRNRSCLTMAKHSAQPNANPAKGSDSSSEVHPVSGRSDQLQTAVAIINQGLPEKLESKETFGELSALGQQVGEGKTTDDSPGSALTLPFGDSWPDPCIEFAFRTLTGDIPVLEDSKAIQDYFQLISIQSPSSSAPITCCSSESSSQAKLLVQPGSPEKLCLSFRNDGRTCSSGNRLLSTDNVDKECHQKTRLN